MEYNREMISTIFSKYYQDTFVNRERRIAVINQIIDREWETGIHFEAEVL